MKQSSLPWTLANLGSHSTDRSYHALHENACRLLNFVLGNRLKKVLSRVADIICITQITYKMINNALLMENWRLVFFRFENLFLFLAYINWLQSGANFIIKIMQLPPNSIGWSYVAVISVSPRYAYWRVSRMKTGTIQCDYESVRASQYWLTFYRFKFWVLFHSWWFQCWCYCSS